MGSLLASYMDSNSGFIASSQIPWKNFDKVKIGSDSNNSSKWLNYDDSDEIWMVYLGREVKRGVYVLLDDEKSPTGNLIYLNKSRLSGLWGWLTLYKTNKGKPSSKRLNQGKGYFPDGYYELMLNPYDY